MRGPPRIGAVRHLVSLRTVAVVDSVRMSDRIAGHSVMAEVVRLQNAVPPRSALARAFGVRPLSSDAHPWFLGALGEREVGSLLERLPSSWTVFHAVPVGDDDADIDHLVVGPGGVFVINTKNHDGKRIWVAERTVMVDGTKVPYARNSELEASRIRGVLAAAEIVAPVHAVVAVLGAKSFLVRQQPQRVAVLEAERLLRWLTRRNPVIDGATQAAIVELFDDPATWRCIDGGSETAARFDSIAREVRSARAVRLGWLVAGVLAVIAAAVPFTHGLLPPY